MSFSVAKADHSRYVAIFMQGTAPTLGLNPEEAAFCGWIHDFGYFFGDEASHNFKSGMLLKKMNYKFSYELYNQGKFSGIITPMGALLNIADMSISESGELVSFDSRLGEIAKESGDRSKRYRDSKDLVYALRNTPEYAKLKKGGFLY